MIHSFEFRRRSSIYFSHRNFRIMDCEYLQNGRECVVEHLEQRLDHEFVDVALLIILHDVVYHFHRQFVASHDQEVLEQALELVVIHFGKPLALSRDLQLKINK